MRGMLCWFVSLVKQCGFRVYQVTNIISGDRIGWAHLGFSVDLCYMYIGREGRGGGQVRRHIPFIVRYTWRVHQQYGGTF